MAPLIPDRLAEFCTTPRAPVLYVGPLSTPSTAWVGSDRSCWRSWKTWSMGRPLSSEAATPLPTAGSSGLLILLARVGLSMKVSRMPWVLARWASVRV